MYYLLVKRHLVLSALVICVLFSGCPSLFRNPFGGGGDDGDDSSSTLPSRVIEPTAKFSLAIGGVAPGRDELVIYDENGNERDFSGQILACAPGDPILITRPRPDFDTEAEGSGVQLIATDPGVTALGCTIDGAEMEEKWEVTIPPQNLIQILVAEAREQIDDEAQIDEEGNVMLTSLSGTAGALGSVIRNRINLISANGDPALFAADARRYDIDPPASYYDEIITAQDQFSPVNPGDASHDTFDSAQDRNFLTEDLLRAYDQAVLTAAGIFNGDIADSTGGAFAFRSPNEDEWGAIATAWTLYYYWVPESTGFADANYPSLAPIQLLIHPDVWKYTDGRPSFVFARQRTLDNFAVVNTP